MKTKLKKIIVPFILLAIFYNISFIFDEILNFGMLSPHVGILFISGLLFGPYGAIGATAANMLCDSINGYAPFEVIISGIFSFGISILAYKIWYSGINTDKITKPILDNTFHLLLFLADLVICGFIYAIVHGNLYMIIAGGNTTVFMTMKYFMNFINISFIFGILSIWISKKISFVHTPKTVTKNLNNKLYKFLFYSLLTAALILGISLFVKLDKSIITGLILLIGFLMFSYITKHFNYKITPVKDVSISERVTTIFLITTLVLVIYGIVVSYVVGDFSSLININLLDDYFPAMPLLAVVDIIILLFFVPGMIVIRFVETNVTKPISSFSQIEEFINVNERIETEGLVNVYSDYLNQQDEIGMLARSYTDLIKHNNNYIENIREIEGEKKRIETELDIATRIQQENLPTEAIKTEDYTVNGYSQPAREVGGDFFDYYQLDEDNLAIVIGDVSDKGIPAAILAMIAQFMIKQLFKNNRDPSKILYMLNNQLCEHNSESMFITLLLGVYNKPTGKLTFSNAGHNPPLFKENDKFHYLNIDSGVVLGIMQDFEFVKEEIQLNDEIIIYTDGITDANNLENKMYGEERLKDFFNNFKSNNDPIVPLLSDIDKFTEGQVQFDDMTLVYLKIKHD